LVILFDLLASAHPILIIEFHGCSTTYGSNTVRILNDMQGFVYGFGGEDNPVPSEEAAVRTRAWSTSWFTVNLRNLERTTARKQKIKLACCMSQTPTESHLSCRFASIGLRTGRMNCAWSWQMIRRGRVFLVVLVQVCTRLVRAAHANFCLSERSSSQVSRGLACHRGGLLVPPLVCRNQSCRNALDQLCVVCI
jgi:hypothetical protein